MLKYKGTVNNQTLWGFYQKTSGIDYETDDLVQLQGEIVYLLGQNPIPVLQVVQVVPFDVDITIPSP